MTPRCGRAMRLMEAAWGALPDGLRCGRPAGHNGPHRSVQALAKAAELERRTWARRSALRRERQVPSAGRRIREVRHWAGMSQQALGAAVGVSQKSISHWELDRFCPGAAVLLEIAAVTGAPAAWLLPEAVSRAA